METGLIEAREDRGAVGDILEDYANKGARLMEVL